MVLLDAGANADCRPSICWSSGCWGPPTPARCSDRAEPRVGLLNIGEEKRQGQRAGVGRPRLLAASRLNFVGNVEGRDLLRNTADVVVTDGFTGNVALKCEGCARRSSPESRRRPRRTRAKAGGMLLRPALRGLRTMLDPEEYGGTYLLGVRGLVVICHGNSSRRAIANALRFGAEALRKECWRPWREEVSGIDRAHGYVCRVLTAVDTMGRSADWTGQYPSCT